MKQIAGHAAIGAALFLSLVSGDPAAAQETPVFGQRVASVTFGPYARLDIGRSSVAPDDGFWLPPNYPNDPQVNFDLSAEDATLAGIGIGYDWQNGFRADLTLLGTGTSFVSGDCSSASNASDCGIHADITGASVQTRALMASVYYAPLEQRGSNSIVQPFVVAGIGLARSEVGPWTRENPFANQEVRTFAGDTSTSLAFSVGLGVAVQLTRPGAWPVIAEASWRYYDFGSVSGGTEPITVGGGIPQQALTFRNTQQVVGIGIRIPLQRY